MKKYLKKQKALAPKCRVTVGIPRGIRGRCSQCRWGRRRIIRWIRPICNMWEEGKLDVDFGSGNVYDFPVECKTHHHFLEIVGRISNEKSLMFTKKYRYVWNYWNLTCSKGFLSQRIWIYRVSGKNRSMENAKTNVKTVRKGLFWVNPMQETSERTAA